MNPPRKARAEPRVPQARGVPPRQDAEAVVLDLVKPPLPAPRAHAERSVAANSALWKRVAAPYGTHAEVRAAAAGKAVHYRNQVRRWI